MRPRYRPDDLAVHQTLWAYVQRSLADRAVGPPAEVSDTGDSTTGIALCRMIRAEFISAAITSEFRLSAADRARLDHGSRPSISLTH